MNLLDRLRITVAVWWYGTWLDLHNVPGRRRRELRRDLRANLREAAASKGAAAAVRDLGGVRRLAAEMAAANPRPRWAAAAIFGFTAGMLVLLAELFAALNFASGAEAADPTAPVRGALFPFPGSEVIYTPPAGEVGLAVEFAFGWLFLAVAALVFVAVARPWRLVTERRAKAA